MNLDNTLLLYCGGVGSGCRGPNCGRKATKQEINMLRKVAQDYQFNELGAVDKLKRLARHAVKGGKFEDFHPGNMTLYRGGTHYGVSWSKSKAVARRYAMELSSSPSMQYVGKIHTINIDKNTPALDIQRLTRGWSSRSGNEREVFVIGARNVPRKTEVMKKDF